MLTVMVAKGVPAEALNALGVTSEVHQKLSFTDLLRHLPDEEAVQLQFWQSVPGEQRRQLEHAFPAEQHCRCRVHKIPFKMPMPLQSSTPWPANTESPNTYLGQCKCGLKTHNVISPPRFIHC